MPGYRILSELLRDERRILCRAERLKDGAIVLLRTVTSPNDTFEASALRREHEILSSLDVAGVARPESFEVGGVLVLQDIGGRPLSSLLASEHLSLEAFFEIALSLATALAELHRSQIIHKNLNPEGILVEPESRRVQLFDFSIASRLSQEMPPARPPHRLEGRLTHVSPEQTGRMNRIVDYRTDFYSLGATFYEMLVGQPPFTSEDPLELVHCHVAKLPPSPAELNADVPRQLARVVMKLLAKTAEERYQSASGLLADLETCARRWRERGEIGDFPLGERDIPDRFTIPQRLYGRQAETEALLATFERVCGGSVALMLVSGYSGVGKTSLVREIQKPIVRRRGRFVSGKFDQLERNVPYGALLQALRGLVRQVLAEKEEEMTSARELLRDALGGNAGVVAAVIPELTVLLGPQPPAPELPAAEAQNRFNYLFQRFIAVFAKAEHPLVILLDDLQWVDGATLRLLSVLLTDPGVRHLFVIGAYRDNEVSSDHPLVKMLAEVREVESGSREIAEIHVAPLGLPDLTRFAGDALHRDEDESRPLARLLLRKTDGNPFFVTQFLKSLHADGLIGFDRSRRSWSFDLDRIEQAGITDNVVDLMGRKLRSFSGPAQQAIALAACIGNAFTLATLATVREKTLGSVASELWEAIEAGLILPAAGYGQIAGASDDVLAWAAPSYRFLHDRVQQAAYALIPGDQETPVHLRVGRLLLAESRPEIRGEKIFEIANHLNRGSALMAEEAERLELARLNLAAGRRAKSSAAFQAALEYFDSGLALLTGDHWRAEHDLAFSLAVEAAEAKSLCRRFEEAEADFDRLLERANTRLEKALVYNLKILQHENLSAYSDAIRVGRQAFALFGLTLPGAAAKREALEAEVASIDRLLADRPIESLVDLPPMHDPEIRAVMKLATMLHTSCYLSGDKDLTIWNTATMVRLSLEHGNTEESAYAYALYAAMFLGPLKADSRSAYAFGLLAERVNGRFPNPAVRARVLMNVAWAVSPWRRPMEESLPITRESARLGNEAGLFVEASYALFNECWLSLLCARDLATARRTATACLEYTRRIKMHHFAASPQLMLQWGLALEGATRNGFSLSDDNFDEEGFRRTYSGQSLFEMFYFVAKLALLYTFDEHEAAHETAGQAERVIEEYPGTIWDELTVFYHALTLLALPPASDPRQRQANEGKVRGLGERLAAWAANCAENFEAQYRIVLAETARWSGRRAEAPALYEAAIASGGVRPCPREEALACELYGKFWLEGGQARAAAVFLSQARDAYRRWGAKAKVEDLERRYPSLLSPAAASARPSGSVAGALDVLTAVKAAHAISSEIELDRLVKKLVRIAIENAGAERGLLLREESKEIFVACQGSLRFGEALIPPRVPLASRPDLCHAAVHLARRTGESVLIADASTDPLWLGDPYVAASSPRSILCVPILNQGRRTGLLYLENNLTPDAFTSEHVEMMRILASQAAISLENARLYEEKKDQIEMRARAEEALREALAQVDALKNRLEAENLYLKEEIRTERNFEEIVGNSPALLAALGEVERVAETDSTVLLLGETGTGKELFARAVHSRSRRRERPLVKVNCGAIPAGLVESELFGHVRGAFTGALDKRAGRFELANGGTIFLDEVVELPLETQVKLLRVLQEKEFEPVGGSRTVRVDVRVLAASNRDLEEAVRAGTFRADLMYRLNVFPVRVPALRERRADIPLLVTFFLDSLSKRLVKRLDGCSRGSMERLTKYSWPGNVRELQNVLERAAILARGPVLEIEASLLGSTQTAGPDAGGPRTLEELERSHIQAALKSTGGVVEGPRGAASILGLHPNTLRSRIKKLRIERGRPHEMT
jgi:predicted ATPase/transcriptional regulator with GAF, ATPase, and Fis domain